MDYNLSDIVRFRHTKGLHFPGSIGCRYLNYLNEGLNNNFTSYPNLPVHFYKLTDIIKSYNRPVIKNCLCIHMRLSDVLLLGIKYDVVQVVERHDLHKKLNKCKLFYGNPANVCGQESKDIIDDVTARLKNLGMDVDLVSNSADEDFIDMSQSEYFIPTTRGFSWLAASLNPNNVYWDIQNVPEFDWLLNKSFRSRLAQGYHYHQAIKTNV